MWNEFNKLIVIKLLISLFLYSNLLCQNFGTGLILKDEKLANMPRLSPLTRGSFQDLPPKYTLRPFTPAAGNQGATSTCTGWAIAYSARTILEALSFPKQKKSIVQNPFSPSFIYNKIRRQPNCTGGTSIVEACDVLLKTGVLPLSEFSFDCSKEITKKDSIIAFQYRIKEYQELFFSGTKNKTLLTKKSIGENKPVVIGLNTPNSFYYASEVWTPDSTDYNKYHDGHALTVVSYDDNKFGGAFEILNSWGANWGDNGFTWIKYPDFESFTAFGIQLIPTLPDSLQPKLSGRLKIVQLDGSAIELRKDGNVFSTKSGHKSNTIFKILLTSNEPAYIYAISSDLTGIVELVFPFNEKISPYIPYKNTEIEIPDGSHYFRLDSTKGTTYLLFVYSKKRMEINDVVNSIQNGKKSFIENAVSVLEDEFNSLGNVDINLKAEKEINFESFTPFHEVVPILISILHE